MGIFSKKKVNTEQESSDNNESKSVASLNIKRTGDSVDRAKVFSSGAFVAATGIVALMGAVFAASAVMSYEGAFTIKAIPPGDGVVDKAISLSETRGFSNSTVNLKAEVMDNMDNTTYAWLPMEELDAYDGSHNGEKYIAYTFYLKNVGTETLDYSTSLDIVNSSLGIDKAVRVIIYKDGVPTVYAKEREDGTREPYPKDVVNFYDENTVTHTLEKGLKSGQTVRYTAVVWLEGEDPECVDDVRGGTMKMEMVFEIIGEEETDPPNSESPEPVTEDTGGNTAA